MPSAAAVGARLPLFLAALARPSIFTSPSRADEARAAPLGREEVIARAGERAPAVLRALADIQAAEARVVRAERLTARDPTLQASAGPRFGDGVAPDISVRAWLPVPLLVDRARSVHAARSGVKTAEVGAEAVRLAAVGVALDLYIDVLYAKERLSLAKARRSLARRLREAAAARLAAGDASRLEAELAHAEEAASAAAVLAAEGALSGATGSLALALATPQLRPGDIEGALAEEIALPGSAPEGADPAIARGLEERPDVRAAEAALDGARAARERAALGWLPEVSVGAGYGLEEGAHVGTVGLRVGLPLFDFGQADIAEAEAARSRGEREVELRRLAARIEIARATAVHRKALAAARVLDADALPRAAAVEDLATRSYAAGKADLASLLIVRRDTLSIRAEHLARQRDAALAANQVVIAAGLLPAAPARDHPHRRSP